ncbi:hypothetical protein CF326_g3553 [Tilletia indica]|nr:hypothetical protein CF326_g3553 [Tilletia indica]
MPPRQSIQFEGPPVPAFLARLQAQIQGSSSTASDRHLDPHLEARRKAKREEIEERKRIRAESGQTTANGDEDEDDEFDGAQVVVLDEGKDLSREQALGGQESVNTKGPSEGGQSQPTSETIATAGTKRKAEDQAGPSSSTKLSKGLGTLAEEVAKHKKGSETPGQKEKERKEKNKRAAKEKKKAGKGLSFDI